MIFMFVGLSGKDDYFVIIWGILLLLLEVMWCDISDKVYGCIDVIIWLICFEMIYCEFLFLMYLLCGSVGIDWLDKFNLNEYDILFIIFEYLY